jgi:Protein of unknown function (DUF3830)
MGRVQIQSEDFIFEAVAEEKAPKTVEWFTSQLPFASEVIHARWSGEAVWIPLGDLATDLALENNTAFPSIGEILFYPGGISETEILLTYGSAAFASKAGTLSGNHFLTIVSGAERLAEFGKRILWGGALDILFTHLD